MREKLMLYCSTAVLAVSTAMTPAQTAPVDTGDANSGQSLLKLEAPAAVEKRLQWWSDARFGMFIHWGLYSEDGCFYKGTNGGSEHMMLHLKIPLADYRKIADEFNPTNFNARQWVGIAKDAGMKYMVITSKHHDGFAMYNSPSSPKYNIVSCTPWKRDPIKELAAECKRQGLKFGVYYSLGRDWADPDVPTRDGYRSNTWDYPDENKKVFARYFERKVKPQIRELLTQYGPIAVLWFDTPERISKEESEELVRLIHSLQPNCIINQRVGNRLGDYRVAEQNIPANGFSDPWETCMTLNRHWGYFKGDESWKPADTVIHNLIDIVSKGGNYLLNVGPTGQGIIPGGAVADLQAVGAWMKANGEAIYGTSASPFKTRPDWGRVTKKGDTLYLHVFEWPKDGVISLPIVSDIRSASVLKGGGKLAVVTTNGQGIQIRVPAAAPDPISSTIVLKLKGPLRIKQS
jgi:alpha-L-fucosidase